MKTKPGGARRKLTGRHEGGRGGRWRGSRWRRLDRSTRRGRTRRCRRGGSQIRRGLCRRRSRACDLGTCEPQATGKAHVREPIGSDAGSERGSAPDTRRQRHQAFQVVSKACRAQRARRGVFGWSSPPAANLLRSMPSPTDACRSSALHSAISCAGGRQVQKVRCRGGAWRARALRPHSAGRGGGALGARPGSARRRSASRSAPAADGVSMVATLHAEPSRRSRPLHGLTRREYLKAKTLGISYNVMYFEPLDLKASLSKFVQGPRGCAAAR